MTFTAAAALFNDWRDVFARIWDYLNKQLTFGRISISAAGLIMATVAIVSTVVVSRFASNFVERRLAKRSHIDAGLRYTILRLIRYCVVTVGFLIAIRQGLGVDLTSLAVIFTALSVGIGFGLQYLAADIASGFILLFERPIRVGDRITIGEDEGDVESINLRTTVVSTNDRIAIIIPNSKLVSQRVINWSYADPRARISIPIGVADDSDLDQVTQTLIDAAKEVDFVLPDPPPRVQFMKFGDYTLDFRLLVWTNQPRRHPQIRSDINYRIYKLFHARNIRIPYPTQQFLLKGLPKELEAGLTSDDGPHMKE
ncbi:MAG TPA: mechanosensitive ion channel domain-containing protein [Pyrinomonadaceae bacterium]|jgi:potassium-dependent mechanosensitive channel|nr:mechanosensitive ion channel domain-containing protein [Pyrinomonadaceae bacterium]